MILSNNHKWNKSNFDIYSSSVAKKYTLLFDLLRNPDVEWEALTIEQNWETSALFPVIWPEIKQFIIVQVILTLCEYNFDHITYD